MSYTSLKGAAVGAAMLMASATFGTALAQSADPIKIAINEWTGQHISAHIAGELLKKAGFNVEYVTAGAVPQFAAIAQGNLHLQPEVWDNNVGDIYPKAVESGDIVQLGELGLAPREGWIYPPYMEEKCPGLPAADALVKCAQAFGSAETFPKGRLITYPADWGTRSKDLVENAGLPLMPVAGGSEGAMIAELKSAYAAKQPMLMMFWAPHWIHAEVKLNWIDLPAAAADCDTNPAPGFDASKTGDCGFAQASIGKVVWKGFKDKWPGAYKLVDALALDNESQNLMMLEIDNKGRKLEEVVAEWIANNE
ncbi:MAG: ABC transporter substrate-binding protein, partial [Aestuariivirgaceae bacterium]